MNNALTPTIKKNTRYKIADLANPLLSDVVLNQKEVTHPYDLENMLGCYLNDQGLWEFNLNASFYIENIPDSVCLYYITPTQLHWPTISWNIYNSTRLAWFLMKLNGIRDGNVFEPVPAGAKIRYLDKSKFISEIVKALGDN